MNKLTTLSKATVEASYPGLCEALKISSDAEPKFLALTTAGTYFTEKDPTMKVSVVSIPVIGTEKLVKSAQVKEVFTKPLKTFDITLTDIALKDLGYDCLLMLNHEVSIYSVPNGSRPGPVAPAYQLAGDATTYTLNGLTGHLDESGNRYVTANELDYDFDDEILATLKMSFNNTEFEYGHNVGIAVSALTVGDYKCYGSASSTDTKGIVEIRTDETHKRTITIKVTPICEVYFSIADSTI